MDRKSISIAIAIAAALFGGRLLGICGHHGCADATRPRRKVTLGSSPKIEWY